MGSSQPQGRQANPDAEIARFRDRLKSDPASLAFLPLAEALRKSGKLDEAKSVCLEGLSHHPDYISGQVVLAKILSDSGDTGGAREALERVVEATPDHLLANKLLAQNYLLAGMAERARGRLATVIMLNPGDEEAAAALAALEREAHPTAAPPAVGVTARVETPATAMAQPVPEPLPAPPAEVVVPAVAESMMMELPETVPAVEEVFVEGEDESAEGPFLEFSGLSGIDDVEEIEEVEEPVVEWEAEVEEEESPVAETPTEEVTAPAVEPPITLPGLLDEGSGAPLEEITSETLADLYLSQDLPEKAVRIYREMLVEEPGNERVAMKLNRALAAQRTTTGMAQAPAAPREPAVRRKEEGRAAAVPGATPEGGQKTRILIARLEAWLTTIGERRRGIH